MTQNLDAILWHPKNKYEFDLIHGENYIIETKDEISNIKEHLKNSKHACLYLRMEYPRSYKKI